MWNLQYALNARLAILGATQDAKKRIYIQFGRKYLSQKKNKKSEIVLYAMIPFRLTFKICFGLNWLDYSFSVYSVQKCDGTWHSVARTLC